MSDGATNIELVAKIYAAASHPEIARETMTLLADEIGADGTQALVYAEGGDSVQLCVGGRVNPAADEDYIKHYHAADFRVRRALAATSWVVHDDEAFVTAKERVAVRSIRSS